MGLFDFVGDIFGGDAEVQPAAPASSTTTTEPWSVQKPYLEEIFEEAQKQYQDGLPDFYPGQGIAPFSADQQTAMGMVRDRALAGSPLVLSGADQLKSTLEGAYLGANPYLDEIIGTAQDEAQSRLASTFGRSGRYGSGLHKIGLGKELMGIEADVRGKAYENERNRQMSAATMVPSFTTLDYLDANALMDTGATQQRQEQLGLDYDRAKYDYESNRPQNALMNYLNMIQGNYGGTSTGQATPYEPESGGFNVGGAVGGALAGSQLFGPWGAIGGGILGGIF